jgi:IclR family acetate operon transcriptional repressor
MTDPAAVGPAAASAAAHSPAAAGAAAHSPAADGDQRYRLRSVERALDALELLAGAGQGGLTLTELADRLAVAKSSAFALLHTLAARGYAAESGGRLDRTYRLGMTLAKLGDAAERQSPLIVLAMPVLQSITDDTGLTARLVVPDGAYAVAVARVALLAALPPAAARALAVEAGLPPRTPRTITDPDALTRDLEVSAGRGYAIDDEEDCEGVFCVGAAVYDRTGECVAALSGTGLKLNRPTWRVDELGVAVRDAADQLTLALGGTPFADRGRPDSSRGEVRG